MTEVSKPKIRILHLEDLSSDAEIIKRVLQKSGLDFELLWVNNKTNFQIELSEFKPDLILSDHSLPSITSVEAFQMVKNLHLCIPFILITATVSEEFAVNMMKEGIEDYILKDRLQRLPQSITNALDKNRIEEEKRTYLKETINKEKRFRALIENISDAVLLIAENGSISYFSPSAARIMGQSELTGLNFFDLISKDDLGAICEDISTISKNNGYSIQNTYRILHPVTEFKWVEGTLTNLLCDESVQGFTVSFRDITERRAAELRLKKSKADLQTIFNNTNVAYVLLDRNFVVVSFNDQAKKKYKSEMGVDLEERTDIVGCLGQEIKSAMIRKFNKVLSGEKVSYETFYIQEDKSIAWYNVDLSPVLGEGKMVLGILCASEDITKRKNSDIEKEIMTRDIIQRNTNLEQFAYIISHNLRSPVANILGLAELLKEPSKLKVSERRTCMEGFSQAVVKLDEVITDLNKIVQTRRGLDAKKEVVNLKELIRDIVSSIDDQIAQHDIIFKTNFKVLNLFTIKTYLTSIIFNLITNSIKYRRQEEQTIISIETRRENGYNMLIVADNGMGIDLEKYQDKVFGLYKRFHNHVDGKGMGLYMVKTQIETLGGTVQIASEVNKGTEFTVVFRE